MSRSFANSRLHIESLEQRLPFAGDIDARAIGNVLYINGDSTANGVAVHTTSQGVIEVVGLDADGSATTVNSQASESFVRIQDIVINLASGNDVLVLTDLTVNGSATVRTGNGDDFIGLGQFDKDDDLVDGLLDDLDDDFFGEITVKTSLAIDAEEDNDTLLARNASFKLTTITTAEGNDSIKFDGRGESGDPNYIPGVTITSSLIIDAGEGINDVTMEHMTAQDMSLALGNAADTVEIENSTFAKGANINAKNGANDISLEQVDGKSLSISLGVGNDKVSMEELTMTGRIAINDNFGDDEVKLDDVTAKSLRVSQGIGNDKLELSSVTIDKSIDLTTGEGDDEVKLVAVIAKSLSIGLEDGNDELEFDNVAVTKGIDLRGGLGNDTVTLKNTSASILLVSLGLGDDPLTLDHVIVNKKTTLDGGLGTNVYTDLGGNTLVKLKQTNFTTII